MGGEYQGSSDSRVPTLAQSSLITAVWVIVIFSSARHMLSLMTRMNAWVVATVSLKVHTREICVY